MSNNKKRLDRIEEMVQRQQAKVAKPKLNFGNVPPDELRWWIDKFKLVQQHGADVENSPILTDADKAEIARISSLIKPTE